MSQPALTFGNLTLCAPSNGLDGYVAKRRKTQMPETLEDRIPNTRGRIIIIIGHGQSDETSFRLEVDCRICFASMALLNQFVSSVESVILDKRQILSSVSWGYLNEAEIFSEESCRMMVEWGEVWISAAGFWVDFTAVFSRY